MINFMIIDLTHTSRFSAALAVALFAATASAQTTTPPTTTPSPCPSTTAPVLQSFSVENALTPSQILSTMTPTLPPGVAPIGGGSALEIRQFATFDSTNQLLTLNLFTVQSGAPLPTPTGTIVPSSIFSILSIKADKVYTSCTPNASVMIVGTIATNTPSSPFGNLVGAPAAVSIGLTSDNPPKITNVVTLTAGTVVAYAASGGGTVTFTAGTVTPPGSGGGPVVVIAPAGPTAYPIVDLDASGTTGPNTPLTFLWALVSGAASQPINPTAAKTTAIIYGGAGIYTFSVTVTDSKGNVATKTINIQFL
jgi:hypothetical protein